MPLFVFPALSVFLLGMIAYAILSANYYYSRAQTQGWAGFWQWMSHGGPLSFIFSSVAHLFTSVLSNWMAQAVQAVDAHIATTFHYVAGQIRQMNDTFLQMSAFALTVAQAISGQVSWAHVNQALAELRHTIRGAEAAARAAETRVIANEKQAVHSIAQGVYPRLRAIEHEIAKPIEGEIKSARALAREAENEAIRAFKFARKHEAAIGSTAFAGAVAWAISRLGLGWTRCSSNPFNNNPNACGLWSVLGRVLGLAAFLTIAFDFQEFVAASEEVATFIGSAVSELEGTFALSLAPLPPPQ